MSRTFINQSTQIGNSRVYDDTLVPGPELEFTGSESSIHDDLNALRSMTQEVLGTANWYDSPINTITGLDSGKLSLSGGTMSGTLDMGGFVISNVPTPITGTDIVNANYLGDVGAAAHFRYSKEYAAVITPTLSGTDLAVNEAAGTNPTLGVDASLAVPFLISSGYEPPNAPMIADFNLYSNLHFNGQLLRYGHDFEFGSTAGTLRFAFDLEANDVICLISDNYSGLPAPGGGGGGGGPGILTIDAFSYNSSVNRTQFTLRIDGVTWSGSLTAPVELTVNGVTLPLAIQSQAVGTQSTFYVTGEWPTISAGDVVTYAPFNGTTTTVSHMNWINKSGATVSKITLDLLLSEGVTITFGGETLTITNVDSMSSNEDGTVTGGYVLSGLFTTPPAAGDTVSFAHP